MNLLRRIGDAIAFAVAVWRVLRPQPAVQKPMPPKVEAEKLDDWRETPKGDVN